MFLDNFRFHDFPFHRRVVVKQKSMKEIKSDFTKHLQKNNPIVEKPKNGIRNFFPAKKVIAAKNAVVRKTMQKLKL